MSDMGSVIVPKSDQLNADDLIAGPMTVKITGVVIRAGQEQPISISFDGDNGKPYKPCKSMCRVMVTAWGADSKKYTGRSMTLYRDTSVKWGGMEVGGIRISHMSDIDSAITLALTMTRANKKPFTVRPLAKSVDKSANPQGQAVDKSPNLQGDAPACITDEQIAAIEARCTEHGISIDRVKAAAKVNALAEIPAGRYDAAMTWIGKQIDAGVPA